MRVKIACCLVMGLFLGMMGWPAVPGAGAAEYATYTNARFGYVIKYPPKLLRPQGESVNQDGQRFISPDGEAVLAVWGAYNTLEESLQDNFQAAARESGGLITYQVLKDDWFVLSGVKDGSIFYQKTLYHRDTFKTFVFTYPESQRQLYDGIIEVMVKSFKNR